MTEHAGESRTVDNSRPLDAPSASTVIRGDARHLPLGDESVDLVVTSPPYYGQRDYEDDGASLDGQIGDEPTPQEYVESLLTVTAECSRALKATGSIFVNLGDKYVSDNRGSGHDAKRGKAKHAPRGPRGYRTGGMPHKSLMGLPWRYALGCIDRLGLTLRAELVWHKPNGLPDSALDRVGRTHEQWFHFTKGPRYFSDIDAVREQHDEHTLYCDEWERAQGGYERVRLNPNRVDGGRPRSNPHPLGKVPGSVWKIATDGLTVPDHIDVDHFAAFPREWPRRLILGWSPIGGVVLDPFGGTGTTVMAAHALGRRGVGVELSEDYCRLARWRIFESDGASKIREATNRSAQGALL